MREPVFRRYFVALKPPPLVAAEVGFWRDSFVVGGVPVSNDRLHITFAMLGDFNTVPRALLARTREALAGFALPPCRIVLDRLIGSGQSVLLVPSEPLHVLRDLQASLAARLAAHGIKLAPWWRFSPHVTLLHDHSYAGAWPIDAISWIADELILVESLVGQTRHVTRGSWPLAA